MNLELCQTLELVLFGFWNLGWLGDRAAFPKGYIGGGESIQDEPGGPGVWSAEGCFTARLGGCPSGAEVGLESSGQELAGQRK